METQQNNLNRQVPLPNATAVLVLGITSIVLCWCQGIVGLILAIVALVLASRDLSMYASNPQNFTLNSYNNVKTGRTIAIIGLILAGIFLFTIIIGLLFLGMNFALFPWDYMEGFEY
jgi:succinate dehydrogenase/fumarate reductase cytochrome b subunit